MCFRHVCVLCLYSYLKCPPSHVRASRSHIHIYRAKSAEDDEDGVMTRACQRVCLEGYACMVSEWCHTILFFLYQRAQCSRPMTCLMTVFLKHEQKKTGEEKTHRETRAGFKQGGVYIYVYIYAGLLFFYIIFKKKCAYYDLRFKMSGQLFKCANFLKNNYQCFLMLQKIVLFNIGVSDKQKIFSLLPVYLRFKFLLSR